MNSGLKRLLLTLVCFTMTILGLAVCAYAHDKPISYLQIRHEKDSQNVSTLEFKLEAPAIDWAHELEDITPDRLMAQSILDDRKERLFKFVSERILLEANGKPLTLNAGSIEAVRDSLDVRLTGRYQLEDAPKSFNLKCLLFPYDDRHKTYVTYYVGENLRSEYILEKGKDTVEIKVKGQQSIVEVIGQFIVEGIHHIFIGPDHILFIISLMLLPVSLTKLLKIVSAFTVAHSITLILATLNILNPPSKLVESIIALSIVIVGVYTLMQLWMLRKVNAAPTDQVATDKPKSKFSDQRLFFAFTFGLIHGFGFAGVLKELELPTEAIGWSLLSFNIGVEIGQVVIVLLVAPLLALLHRKKPKFSLGLIGAGAVCVIAMGGFWFIQRILG